MKNTLSLVVATLVLFIWNAISWMALPFHSSALKNIPDGVLADNIETLMPEPGIYHYPGLPEGERSESEIIEMLNSGPRVTIMAYQPGSSELFDPMDFLTSLLLNLLTCGALLMIILKFSPQSMGEVIKWSLILGLLVSFASDFALMNWFKFTFTYTIANVIDHLAGFALVGITFWLFFKNKLTAS